MYDSYSENVNFVLTMTLRSETKSSSYVMHMQKHIFLIQNYQLLRTQGNIHAHLGYVLYFFKITHVEQAAQHMSSGASVHVSLSSQVSQVCNEGYPLRT